MTTIKQLLILSLLVIIMPIEILASGNISGVIRDADTGEPIIGATVMAETTEYATAADYDGQYEFSLPQGVYTLKFQMISYEPVVIKNVTVADSQMVVLDVEMKISAEVLDNVEVVAYRVAKNDAGANQAVKTSMTVANAISAQSITRTQDRDAGEVIKRIPGISIINDKFVIVRGLSQRYNNVWINNAAVPSSEADSRAFSFDLIPAGQIETMMIHKSPSPEIPADFTGGFVKITTRDTPDDTPLSATLSVGYNTQSSFRDFLYNNGSSTDWLGFDSGYRSLQGGITGTYDNSDKALVNKMTRNGFNNDWTIRSKTALPDMKFNLSYGSGWNLPDNATFTLNAAMNYSYSTTIYDNMTNSRYGIYNINEDKPEYLYDYTDNRYQESVKWGVLLNLAYLKGKSKIYFRNIFNQIGQSRLTQRTGWQNISSFYEQEKTEYSYTSRSSYCGQFAGIHPLGNGTLDWEAGYTFADKNQPDRRIIDRQQNDLVGDEHYGQMMTEQNDITRDFMKLNEHVASLQANYKVIFNTSNDSFTPELRVGLYGQYRARDYKQRSFFYRYYPDAFNSDFAYGDPVSEILTEDNYGADKLYVYDDTDNRDSYKGDEYAWAAYAAVNLPINKLNVYAGLRMEQTRMTLTSYTKMKDWETKSRHYDYLDLFPSVNATYNITEKHLLRAAYGMSTNRPEFREVSSSVYYDFELFSDIKGNPDLKATYIQNVDLRWEWYPSTAESISVALFYKHFKNPIESTFIDAGGSYTYTFENANSANVYGIEFDVRKNLDFIGVPWLMLNLNCSLIESKVNFDGNTLEHDRPMQGQSPYLVNIGILYQPDTFPLTAGMMYNRIEKRIIGIGRTDITTGNVNNDIPDMYEMPRNALDFSVGYTFAKHYQVKLNVKDVLAEDVQFCQFPKYISADGSITERKQVTRRFNPGTTIQLSFSVKF